MERTINYLRLSVTDRCNYRCRYCMPESGVKKLGHADILSYEELTEITKAAVDCGVTKIRITGGEPLVRKGIETLCQSLRAIAGVEELTLTTNGSLLAGKAETLKLAGVDRLNVSLDTLNAQKFADLTRGGRLADVFDGLRAAKAAGFHGTKLNVVLMDGFNSEEIADFVALTEKDALCIRFIELMPMGAADWSGYLPAAAVLRAVPALKPERTDGVAEVYRVPGYLGTVGLIHPISGSFCERCCRIRVTADGRLKPCLHSDAELSLRGLHGEALRAAILHGIAIKPAGHQLEKTCHTDTHRTMNQIGG